MKGWPLFSPASCLQVRQEGRRERTTSALARLKQADDRTEMEQPSTSSPTPTADTAADTTSKLVAPSHPSMPAAAKLPDSSPVAEERGDPPSYTSHENMTYAPARRRPGRHRGGKSDPAQKEQSCAEACCHSCALCFTGCCAAMFAECCQCNDCC